MNSVGVDGSGHTMMSTDRDRVVESTNRLIGSVRDAEEVALEAVRKFVDTVNGILPDVRDDAPRRKIIDSAVKMTEALVGASTDLAQKIVTASSDAWAQPKRDVDLTA
jgi:hypothetical protein